MAGEDEREVKRMLKALMLRKRIDGKKEELEALKKTAEGFAAREAELAADIEAAQSDEEKAAVEKAIDEFEAEKKENGEQSSALESEIAGMEDELDGLERKQAAGSHGAQEEERTVRSTMSGMENRTVFYGMEMQERTAFFADEGVKALLSSVRDCIREHRAISNVGLTIPEVMLPLIRQEAYGRSKLISRVTLRRVGGTARQVIMGEIPEGVWTEACATLNELSLGFNDIEVDGYKVGGYFKICNAVLEDNDVSLATVLVDALAEAIAKALDKAIVYGTGVKMPLGMVTRLAQTAAPSDYPATARTWEDLHTSHILTGSGATGMNLFKEIASGRKAVTNAYMKSGLIWLMNENTHTDLLINSMDKNASAAIVAGMYETMPVIGGTIIELPFIPDNNIVYGYGDAYLLAERAGIQIGTSEHYRFIEDQTIFKGTARYDGTPVIPEAFGVLTITAEAPATSVNFPSDTAN